MRPVLAHPAAILLFLAACQSDTDFVPRSAGASPTEQPVPFVPPPVVPADAPCDPWCPGEAIPGWPSLAEPSLPDLEGKPIIEVSLPGLTAAAAGGACGAGGYPACDEVSHPGSFSLEFGLCERPTSCGWSEDDVHWYVGVGSGREPQASPPVLGLGWYDGESVAPDGPSICTFYRNKATFTATPTNCGGEWEVEAGSAWHPARVYVSEVRPDRIRGLVYFDTTDYVVTRGEGYVYLMHFEITFPPHGGYGRDFRYPEATFKGLLDRAYWYSTPEYLSDYDTMWPWDSVTDPAIREAVYRMYRPYLDPFYP